MTNHKKPTKAPRRDHKRQQKHWKRKTTDAFFTEWRKVIDEYAAKVEEPKPIDKDRDRLIRHAWAMMGMLIEEKMLDPWELGHVMGDKDKVEIFDQIQEWIDSLYLSLVGIGLEWHD